MAPNSKIVMPNCFKPAKLYLKWIPICTYSICLTQIHRLVPEASNLLLTTTRTCTSCYDTMDIDDLTRQRAVSCAGMISTWCAMKMPFRHRKCLTKLNVHLMKYCSGHSLNCKIWSTCCATICGILRYWKLKALRYKSWGEYLSALRTSDTT